MLVKFLRKDSLNILFVLAAVTLGFWFRSLFGLAAPSQVNLLEYGTPLELMINRFNVAMPELSVWAGFAVMIVVMVMMHSLNNSFIFIPQRTVFPLILFVVLGSSFLSAQHLTPALACLPLVLLALNFMIASYRKDYAESDFFLAAFFLSFASLVYMPIVVLIVTMLLSLVLLRPFSWREWTSMLAGFLVPMLFLVVYNLFFNKDILEDFAAFNFSNFTPAIPDDINSFFGYGFLVSVGLAFMVSILFLVGWTATQKVRTNKIYTIFFILLLNVVLAFILFPFVSKDILVIAAFPTAYIIGVYMVFTRNTFIADTLLLLIAIFALLLQVFPE